MHIIPVKLKATIVSNMVRSVRYIFFYFKLFIRGVQSNLSGYEDHTESKTLVQTLKKGTLRKSEVQNHPDDVQKYKESIESALPAVRKVYLD